MQHKSSIKDLIAKKIQGQSTFASVAQESLAARINEQPICKAIKSSVVARKIKSQTNHISPKWVAPQSSELAVSGFSKTPGIISKRLKLR